MERIIVGFHQDDAGAWVAELDCGHRQHVRHQPPFEQRPWILSAETRAERLGTTRDCPLCDRGGDAPCFADAVCPECGAVLDGSGHRPGCSQT